MEKLTEEITLREYFAAHAPDVPRWFNPDIPESPRWPGNVQDVLINKSLLKFNLDNSVWDLYNEEDESWEWDEDGIVSDEFKLAVKAHLDVITIYYKERDAWEKLKNTITITQWRWYYADQMLRTK